MKKNQPILLLIILFFCLTTACRKTVDVTSTELNTGTQQQTDEAGIGIYPFNKNRCLVDYSDYGNGFFDVITTYFYNSHNNVDSLHDGWNGLHYFVKYDQFDRLKEIHWAFEDQPWDADYRILSYGKGIWPAQLKYIDATYKEDGFSDSVNYVEYFTYNLKGELTQIFGNNLYYPGNYYYLNLEYDNKGNTTSMTFTYSDAPDPVIYKFSDYDHQPNYLGCNFWFKYILPHVTWAYPDILYMFSKNNSGKMITEDGYVEQYMYQYDDNGFAIRKDIQNLDTDGNVVYTATQTNSSTCDMLRPDLRTTIKAPTSTLIIPDRTQQLRDPFWMLKLNRYNRNSFKKK
ncbi:hypothetical protein FC093_13320 [Ilyomonas limi]|uniref:DUF4595 domain-containing protein n=1 Tax=Ilyomonas limi TaxID=2575867 RepID=A0A4U3KYI7_9BACT|nr:hypothetical protein [Ilyomonas limi]TKK67725.1 hypothetical protein FC093_13320 [Ilyomonas limi]